MGLFSKILGDVNRQIARNVTNEVIKTMQQGNTPGQTAPQQTVPQQNVPQQNVQQQTVAPQQPGPSGFSWGPTMPAEENQYSYKGNYVDYFMNIFRAEFPQYQISCSPSRNMQYALITFSLNSRTALVVELLSKSSSVQKWRNNCRSLGTPYLRFYHNVEGWWNTRSYVITRTRNALSL